MGKCKNIECNKIFEAKRDYCSFKCRNYYVNKYLRDYTKNAIGFSKKYKEKYIQKKRYCKNTNCSAELKYNQRRNVFCDHTCSAEYNNKIRTCKKYKKSSRGVLSLLQYKEKPSLCKQCSCKLPYIKKRNLYCSKACRSSFRNKSKSEYLRYRLACRFVFSLNDYPQEFDFGLVEKFGWYKAKNNGNNLLGVSRDHIYSIVMGFKNRVHPYYISHPANCELMRHCENKRKGIKSNISVEDLIKKVNAWDILYGKKLQTNVSNTTFIK